MKKEKIKITPVFNFYANYNAIGHRFKFLPKYSNQRNGFRVCRNAGF